MGVTDTFQFQYNEKFSDGTGSWCGVGVSRGREVSRDKTFYLISWKKRFKSNFSEEVMTTLWPQELLQVDFHNYL